MPILAVLGLFGDASRTIETTGEDVALHVEYSPRQRHGVATSMMILVTNQTDALLEGVILRLDRAYFEGFTQVSFIPSQFCFPKGEMMGTVFRVTFMYVFILIGMRLLGRGLSLAAGGHAGGHRMAWR